MQQKTSTTDYTDCPDDFLTGGNGVNGGETREFNREWTPMNANSDLTGGNRENRGFTTDFTDNADGLMTG
jgi:hypothetical protein